MIIVKKAALFPPFSLLLWRLHPVIGRMRFYINTFISLMKWPVAVAMLLVVPAAFQTIHRYYVIRSQLNFHNLLYFAGGVVFFMIIRFAVIMKNGSAETMEHEMTHTLFAMATLHAVHGIELNDNGSGSMVFSGKGNWLIAIAPYFFPLAAFTMMFFATAVWRITGTQPDWTFMALGCAVGYNLVAFAEQLHPYQTDFKVAGYFFTFCFLPGANFLTFGTILSFVERGMNGVSFFYKLVYYFAKQDFHFVWDSLTRFF